MQHICSIDDVDVGTMAELFQAAKGFRDFPYNKREGGHDKILFNLFYEASTRTSASFHAAMIKIGGDVIPVNNVQYSSVTKGEDLEDTIITAGCYADVIVLRHTETGAATQAAAVSSVPIINAGDGAGEHPTQTLLDAFTIWLHHGRIHGTVALMGDLKNGRTVHSLVKLLSRLYVNFVFIAPDEYQMPGYLLDVLKEHKVLYHVCNDLNEVASEIDVLYMTRVQKERGSNFEYGLTRENVQMFKDDMIVMHPLPRNQELPKWFDTDPRAKYFEQMKNGMWIRMAILTKLLEVT